MNAGIPVNRIRMMLMIALTTAFALGSFWLLEVLHRSAEALGQPHSVHEPDYIVDRFTFIRLSQAGRMRYRVAGVKLTHYMNDIFEIERPVLHRISNQAPPLDAQSQRGVVDDTSRKIFMYQDVRLDRPPAADRQDFHVRSEYLMILPDDDIVQTDKPVEIRSGRSLLTGVGMFANNRTQEFRLMNEVHGTFPPVAH